MPFAVLLVLLSMCSVVPSGTPSMEYRVLNRCDDPIELRLVSRTSQVHGPWVALDPGGSGSLQDVVRSDLSGVPAELREPGGTETVRLDLDEVGTVGDDGADVTIQTDHCPPLALDGSSTSSSAASDASAPDGGDS